MTTVQLPAIQLSDEEAKALQRVIEAHFEGSPEKCVLHALRASGLIASAEGAIDPQVTEIHERLMAEKAELFKRLAQ